MKKPQRRFIYQAFRELRVVDGDTLKGTIDHGNGLIQSGFEFRIDGVDHPENKTPAGRIVTCLLTAMLRGSYSKTSGSRSFFDGWQIESIAKSEKYGRMLAGILFLQDGRIANNWARYSLDHKIARLYNGEGRHVWSKTELTIIEDEVRRIASVANLLLPEFDAGQMWVIRDGELVS